MKSQKTQTALLSDGKTFSKTKKWTVCSSMKTKKKTSFYLISSILCLSKRRNRTRACFASQNLAFSAPITARDAESLSAMDVVGASVVSVNLIRTSYVCAMTAILCFPTITLSECTYEKSRTNRMLLKKSNKKLNTPRKKFLNVPNSFHV